MTGTEANALYREKLQKQLPELIKAMDNEIIATIKRQSVKKIELKCGDEWTLKQCMDHYNRMDYEVCDATPPGQDNNPVMRVSWGNEVRKKAGWVHIVELFALRIIIAWCIGTAIGWVLNKIWDII